MFRHCLTGAFLWDKEAPVNVCWCATTFPDLYAEVTPLHTEMTATETVREYYLHIYKSSMRDSFFILHWIFYAETKHLSLLEELAFPFEGIVLYCKEVGKEGHQQDKAISNERYQQDKAINNKDRTQLKQDNSFIMNIYMHIQGDTKQNIAFVLNLEVCVHS